MRNDSPGPGNYSVAEAHLPSSPKYKYLKLEFEENHKNFIVIMAQDQENILQNQH